MFVSIVKMSSSSKSVRMLKVCKVVVIIYTAMVPFVFTVN